MIVAPVDVTPPPNDAVRTSCRSHLGDGPSLCGDHIRPILGEYYRDPTM